MRMDLPQMFSFQSEIRPMYFSVGDLGSRHPGESLRRWQVSVGRRLVGEDRRGICKGQTEPKRGLMSIVTKTLKLFPNQSEVANVRRFSWGEHFWEIFHQEGEDGTQGRVYKERTGSKKRKFAQLMFLVTKKCFNLQPNTSGIPGQCKKQ